MPETPVTRDQLLASVHELQEGDLLVIRMPASTTMEQFNRFADALAAKKLKGVETFVISNEVAVQVVRPGDKAADLTEAVARAKAHPGTVVEVQD